MRVQAPFAKALRGPRDLPIVENVDIFMASERLMAMGDDARARHALPWSVAGGFSPLRSRRSRPGAGVDRAVGADTPGRHDCLHPAESPRLFPPPGRTGRWVSPGTFGERVWPHRHAAPIPEDHGRWGLGLTAVSAAAAVPLAWGLCAFEPAWTLLGLVLLMGARPRFVHRMVSLPGHGRCRPGLSPPAALEIEGGKDRRVVGGLFPATCPAKDPARMRRARDVG